MEVDDEKWKQRLLRRKRWLKPLFEYVKPGRIVEFGCGNGFVLEDLSRDFPDSSILGIDRNQERLDAVVEKGLTNVETMNVDITSKISLNKSIDTALYVGVLHEVFSLSGKEKVLETLKIGHKALKDDGVLIIQDFLKPTPRLVTLIFKNQKTENMFHRFVQEFRIRTVKYEEIEGGVKLDIGEAVEFMTKYRPPSEEDWVEEMGETHHYFTKEEFHKVATEAGFAVKDSRKLMMMEEYWLEIEEDMEIDFDKPERAWIQLVLQKGDE